MLDVRLDHGAERVVLQVLELRRDQRVCIIPISQEIRRSGVIALGPAVAGPFLVKRLHQNLGCALLPMAGLFGAHSNRRVNSRRTTHGDEAGGK